MKDEMNMSTPVTRGELRDELEHFRQDLKRELATKQELEHAVSQLATKQELGHAVSQLATKQELGHALEMWGGALLARLEPLQGMEQRLLAELARHTKASQESMSKEISVVDEKYADLPGRVSRLESEVVARKRR
jgi:hypothetical protein